MHSNIFIIKVNYVTRLLIYDHRDIYLFIGGVEKYNILLFILGCIMAPIMRKKLYLTSSRKLMVWTQLFEMIRGSVSPQDFGLNSSHIIIVYKLLSRAKVFNKIINFSLLSIIFVLI